MEPSDHDKILSCKILFSIVGMGLLIEWKIWGMYNRSENGCSARVALHAHLLILTLFQLLSN
jgi:hypothetical protein